MSAEKKCRRCGERAETRDNVAETTFWGLIETSTETITRKEVRVASTYVRGHGVDTQVMTCDEKKPLCSPCWGLLIGHFMQGRPVAPVKHEHEWRRGGRIGEYPREVCDLCLQDRIAHELTDSQEPNADACSCGRWGSSPWVHPRWCRAYGPKPTGPDQPNGGSRE